MVSFGAPTGLSSGVQLIDNQYGRYVFQLRARDGAGNESLSNEIAVTFFRPITPSVVTPPAELVEVPLTPLARITPRVIPPLPAGANTRIYTNTELLNGGDEAGRGSTENEGLASIDAVGAQAIAPSTQGWKIFGTAWYWWLFVVAGVVGTWLVVAAAIRRRKALGEVEV